MSSLRPVQRLAAHGLWRDGGSVLLARTATGAPDPSAWTLPGGGLHHGEPPESAAVREVAEQTGLRLAVTGLVGVGSQVVARPEEGTVEHVVRLVYALGRPADEPVPEHGGSTDGSTDGVRLVPQSRLAEISLAPWTREILGLARGPEPARPEHAPAPPAGPAPARAAPRGPRRPPATPAGGSEVVRRQRLGAYAVVRHDGATLLTRLSARTPSPGRWTLPGGGVEWGEPPAAAAVREVAEETGLDVRLDALLEADSVHFTGTSPAGVREDFHGVRLVWQAMAPAWAEPAVVEVDGTTDAAAWFDVDQMSLLPLTELATRFARGGSAPAGASA